MYFFTALFTLSGKKASENLYVNMFKLLLKTLQMNRSLDTSDIFYVMVDAETASLLPKGVTPIILPQPVTLLEGVSWRYKIFDYIVPDVNTTYLYMDTDHLAIKTIRFDAPPDTIGVYPEGDPDNPNYCGHIGWKLDHPGLTSGLWAIRPGSNTLNTLKKIVGIIDENTEANFYTLDQPMFNMVIDIQTRIKYFHPDFISFNGRGNPELAHFINYAGDPGNQWFHWNKGFNLFLDLIKPSNSD